MRREQIGDATLWLGDCREIMPTLGKVDAVITDPPYMFSQSSTGAGKLNPWADMMNAAFWYADILRICRDRIQPNDGSIWWFLNWRTLPTLQRATFDAKMNIESLAVWDKEWIGPGGAKGLRPSYELIAFYAIGDYAIRNRGIPDIWRCAWSSQKPHGHPAEKPASLFERIIKTSGATAVLDPFMGSGTCGEAAAKSGCKFFGIEMEEHWFDIACRRIEAAYKQPRLFEEPRPVLEQAALFEGAA